MSWTYPKSLPCFTLNFVFVDVSPFCELHQNGCFTGISLVRFAKPPWPQTRVLHLEPILFRFNAVPQCATRAMLQITQSILVQLPRVVKGLEHIPFRIDASTPLHAQLDMPRYGLFLIHVHPDQMYPRVPEGTLRFPRSSI